MTAFFPLIFLNLGIINGFVMGGLLLLRPVLTRTLRPQQRVVVWLSVWLTSYIPNWYALSGLLSWFVPFNFRGLFSPRVDTSYAVPSYLPTYQAGGKGNLILPLGQVIPLDSFQLPFRLAALSAIGFLLLACLLDYQGRDLVKKAAARSTLLPDDHPLGYLVGPDICVRLCQGLSTSFLTGRNKTSKAKYNIYLQAELPAHRMEMILRHELAHIRLRHVYFKAIASVGCLFQWWNPLIWLGFRAFCQDLELACDESVIQGMTKSQRADYAQTLLDLASGRPLLYAPLAFGEADAAIRIKRVLSWKAPGHFRQIAAWILAAAVFLFFYAAPSHRPCLADKELAWQVYMEEQGGFSFLAAMNQELTGEGILSSGKTITAGWYQMEPVDETQRLESDKVNVYFQLSDGSWLQTRYFWFGFNNSDWDDHYLYMPLGDFKAIPAPDLTGCQPIS